MKTKAKYRFIEFLRPDGYWPCPYSLEQALGVFRWMATTGRKYGDRGRWGTHTVANLLSKKPTCVGVELDPIDSVEDLRQRFHYAILSDHVGPEVQRWRGDHDINVYGERTVSFLHGDADCSPASMKARFNALLGYSGRLGVQLNQFHSRAREIYGVELCLGSTWSFVLRYGYGGSVWRQTLARQLPRETFCTSMARASRVLDSMVQGNYQLRKRA